MTDFQLVNPENPDLCDPALSQWYTPPELADRIVQWALLTFPDEDRLNVLEPSCGRGALVRPLVEQGHLVTGVDLDPRNVAHCREEFPGAYIVGDFLKLTKIDIRYGLAVMNPVFEDGATEAHVQHALKFAPRVVCHCPLTTLAGKDRREGLWSVAYLKRLVIHASRPKYSGNRTGGMTDMCTIDVVRRPESPLSFQRVASSGVDIVWWP